jgi:hypothetical protein
MWEARRIGLGWTEFCLIKVLGNSLCACNLRMEPTVPSLKHSRNENVLVVSLFLEHTARCTELEIIVLQLNDRRP